MAGAIGAKGNIVLDLPHWQNQTRLTKAETNKGLATALRGEHRLWIKLLLGESYPKRKTQGFRAIDNDLKRAMIQVTKFRSTEIPVGADQGMISLGDKARSFEVHNIDIFHQQARSRRTGRVKKSFGRGRPARRLVAKKQGVSSSARKSKGRVGALKKGWISGCRAMNIPVPGWVANSGKYSGRHLDAVNQDGTGYIETVNNVPYANTKLRRVMAFTLAVRQRAFDTKMKREMAMQMQRASSRRS